MRADSLPLPHGDNFLHLFHLSAKKHNRVKKKKNRLPASYHCRSICALINEPSAAAVVAEMHYTVNKSHAHSGLWGGLQMFPEGDGWSDSAEEETRRCDSSF